MLFHFEERSAMLSRYAAIDIGTVTCRCLVADVSEDQFITRYKGYGITNLGEGVDATGVLKPEAIARVLAKIDEFLAEIRAIEATDGMKARIVAMATSASRDAKNSADLVDKLEERGIVLKVIPGEREAALTFLGASQEYRQKNILVVDIGGGSTELVVGRGGEEPLRGHSFNIGCRRVTEKFLHIDPPDAGEMAEAKKWMDQQFVTFFDGCKEQGIQIDKVVAVAGTATSVVSIREEMAVYDSERVHGAWVSFADLVAVKEKLQSVTVDERAKIVGLDPGRAPVITAGMVILQDILELAGKDGFVASEADILQGIILDEVGQR